MLFFNTSTILKAIRTFWVLETNLKHASDFKVYRILVTTNKSTYNIDVCIKAARDQTINLTSQCYNFFTQHYNIISHG